MLAVLVTVAVNAAGSDDRCSYDTWEWNVHTRRSENHRRVSKPRTELTEEERDPASGCTVCSEDQVLLEVPGAPPIRVCHRVADAVRRALTETVRAGFPVTSLSGYRVGRSRGSVDSRGLRTRFSNHSYGTAIDINADFNGLYGNCIRFDARCTLIRGGAWHPGRPGTVTKDSAVYRAMTRAGWKWAGELDGKQKDFMHFSLTGD